MVDYLLKLDVAGFGTAMRYYFEVKQGRESPTEDVLDKVLHSASSSSLSPLVIRCSLDHFMQSIQGYQEASARAPSNQHGLLGELGDVIYEVSSFYVRPNLASL